MTARRGMPVRAVLVPLFLALAAASPPVMAPNRVPAPKNSPAELASHV